MIYVSWEVIVLSVLGPLPFTSRSWPIRLSVQIAFCVRVSCLVRGKPETCRTRLLVREHRKRRAIVESTARAHAAVAVLRRPPFSGGRGAGNIARLTRSMKLQAKKDAAASVMICLCICDGMVTSENHFRRPA